MKFYISSSKKLKWTKKRHNWETESNWAVAFGRKIGNSWEYSYSTQLRWEIQILRNFTLNFL